MQLTEEERHVFDMYVVAFAAKYNFDYGYSACDTIMDNVEALMQARRKKLAEMEKK
jgi:hypothetical protein